jgi:peptidoglycan hydrolase-like protein with peptidoglycan-binding domain
MSRSIWALTKHHAPAGADRPGRGERRGYPLASAASSAKQYLLTVLIMAGLVGLAAVPTSALAASGSHTDHAAAKGVSASVQPHRLIVLAFGSGYASPTGSRQVRALQHRLARAGFTPGPFDGRYGRLTQAAVMRFQAARGLVVDGIAGPITLGVLRIHGPVLHPGSGYAGNGSTEVRGLQRRLRRAGFSPGPVDGRYGPRTEEAVTRFQASHRLAVDGIAGPVTLARLAHQARERARHGNPVVGRTQHPARTGHKRPGTSKLTGTAKPKGTTKPKGTANPASGSNGTPSTSSSSSGQGSSSSPSLGLILLILALGVLLGVAGSWLVGRLRLSASRNADNPNAVTGPADVADEPVVMPSRDDEAATAPTRDDEAATAPTRDDEPATAPTRDDEAATAPAHDDEPVTAPTRDDTPTSLPLDGDAEPAGEPVGPTHAQTMTQELDTPTDKETEPEWMNDPDRVFAHASWLIEHGDQAGAATAYRRADELGHVGAAVNLGVMSEQQGDVRGAEQWYRRADQVGDPNGSFNLAVLLWEQGRADEAKAAFERADRLGHAAAPTNLGAMLEEQGNSKVAEECYRRADERGDAHGAFNLAALLEETGDHVGALRAYRRASRRGNPEIAEMARTAAADMSRLTKSPATSRPDGGGNGGGR